MLDLQPCVHLDEEHIPAVGNKLDSAGTDIIYGSSCLARGGADRLALGGIKRRRRRFLDHLLMPPLQRAFALEQRQQIAVTVADNLHPDVAWFFDEFLHPHPVLPQSRLPPPLAPSHPA